MNLLKSKQNMVFLVLSFFIGYLMCMQYPLKKSLIEGHTGSHNHWHCPEQGRDSLSTHGDSPDSYLIKYTSGWGFPDKYYTPHGPRAGEHSDGNYCLNRTSNQLNHSGNMDQVLIDSGCLSTVAGLNKMQVFCEPPANTGGYGGGYGGMGAPKDCSAYPPTCTSEETSAYYNRMVGGGG